MNKSGIVSLKMNIEMAMLHFVQTLQLDSWPCGSIVMAIFYPPSLVAHDGYSAPLLTKNSPVESSQTIFLILGCAELHFLSYELAKEHSPNIGNNAGLPTQRAKLISN